MSSRSDYLPDEWAALLRAPVLAGMSVAIADPGGPIEAAKEAVATMKAVTYPPQRRRAPDRGLEGDRGSG